jgi:hypothetical protein
MEWEFRVNGIGTGYGTEPRGGSMGNLNLLLEGVMTISLFSTTSRK